ncbi:MAG: hypothetical protein JSS12_11175, partial [Verrucomicrobia bacterium]|nr:hypothetical protein [Verrucomicrobiota bacterium]
MAICFKCAAQRADGDNVYGLHTTCFLEWFGLSQIHEFLDITAKSQSQAPTEDKQTPNSSFFHGKFRKYSSRLNGVSYILKVEQPEYPELPAMEFLCNKLYKMLKIPVPDHFLIQFPENQMCFVTKNFMQDYMVATLDHIWHFVKQGTQYNCET